MKSLFFFLALACAASAGDNRNGGDMAEFAAILEQIYGDLNNAYNEHVTDQVPEEVKAEVCYGK